MNRGKLVRAWGLARAGTSIPATNVAGMLPMLLSECLVGLLFLFVVGIVSDRWWCIAAGGPWLRSWF